MSKVSWVLFVAVGLWCTPALGQSPLLPVQGRLLDMTGVPVSGSRTVVFSLYDTASGGTPIFTESHDLNFNNGNFIAYLGIDKELDAALFLGAPDLWLGITVEDDIEMQPRLRLGSAPTAAFAYLCGDAATLGGFESADFSRKGHEHLDYSREGHGHSGYYLPIDAAAADVNCSGCVALDEVSLTGEQYILFNASTIPGEPVCLDPVPAKICVLVGVNFAHGIPFHVDETHQTSCYISGGPGSWQICSVRDLRSAAVCTMYCFF